MPGSTSFLLYLGMAVCRGGFGRDQHTLSTRRRRSRERRRVRPTRWSESACCLLLLFLNLLRGGRASRPRVACLFFLSFYLSPSLQFVCTTSGWRVPREVCRCRSAPCGRRSHGLVEHWKGLPSLFSSEYAASASASPQCQSVKQAAVHQSSALLFFCSPSSSRFSVALVLFFPQASFFVFLVACLEPRVKIRNRHSLCSRVASTFCCVSVFISLRMFSSSSQA